MNLSRALRIHRGDVVAVVGAGGKTSTMFRLGDELAALGWCVVTTTSTHISADQVAQASRAIILPAEQANHLTKLPACQAVPTSTLFVGEIDPQTNRAAGLSPAAIDRIASMPDVDLLIAEADGARLLPFKAPADHEPVIPPSSTLVVPIVGIDVVGQPLDDAHVHRPERVSALTGAAPGQAITPEHIVAVLSHTQGGLKGVPSQARVVALVNKVDTEGLANAAHHVADLLLETPRFEAVAIGAVQQPDPIQLVKSRVAVVVLAAGQSQRFGRLKQLLPWGENGGTLLTHAVETALASQSREVVVVLGCEAAACRAALGDRALRPLQGGPVKVVVNPDWALGQSTSVRAGLAALSDNISAVLFHLADQPGVTPVVMNALITRHASTLAPVVWPEYRDRRGNPVLFDRVTFGQLHELTGDVGGKPVLQAYARANQVERVSVDDPGVLLDIDLPEDVPKA